MIKPLIGVIAVTLGLLALAVAARFMLGVTRSNR